MSNLTEFDYGIAEYIWKILKTQQMKVWSWGVDPDTVKTITNGTEFHVQGFLMTGTVRILYDEGMDLFNLEFQKDGDMTEAEKMEHNNNFNDYVSSCMYWNNGTLKPIK